MKKIIRDIASSMSVGSVTTVEKLGNYIYGYLGQSYEIPLPVLYAGSYYAADFPTLQSKPKETFDEISDWFDITSGYMYAYKKGRE